MEGTHYWLVGEAEKKSKASPLREMFLEKAMRIGGCGGEIRPLLVLLLLLCHHLSPLLPLRDQPLVPQCSTAGEGLE